jgi:hypothetical protein
MRLDRLLPMGDVVDIFSALRTATVRPGARWLAAAILVSLFAAGVGVGVYGLGVPKDRGSVVQAGAALLAIVAPLTIAGLLWQFSDSSANALVRRSDLLLEQLLPDRLAWASHRVDLEQSSDTRIAFVPPAHATVEYFHLAGQTACVYAVGAALGQQRLKCWLRVEVIVRRANVAVLLPKDTLENQLKAAGLELSLDSVCTLWAHAVGGAREEGYSFSRPLSEPEKLMGRDYYPLVGSIKLSDDLLWNSAEQFYFAEDLMYFVRAVLHERPSVFTTTTQSDPRPPPSSPMA